MKFDVFNVLPIREDVALVTNTWAGEISASYQVKPFGQINKPVPTVFNLRTVRLNEKIIPFVSDRI